MDEMEKKYHDLLNSGELYDCFDEEMLDYQYSLVQKLSVFNALPWDKEGRKMRDEMLKDLLGTYSKGVFVTSPIFANWGLKHVHLGEGVYINANCDFVDDADIKIGAHSLLGPCVTIVTALHPFSPVLRDVQAEYNKPVTIGKSVWIGASVTILPGVSIGDNSIIGACSLVTKDIPANVIAYGNPCRVIRELNDDDYLYYDHGKKIKPELIGKYPLH